MSAKTTATTSGLYPSGRQTEFKVSDGIEGFTRCQLQRFFYSSTSTATVVSSRTPIALLVTVAAAIVVIGVVVGAVVLLITRRKKRGKISMPGVDVLSVPLSLQHSIAMTTFRRQISKVALTFFVFFCVAREST